MSVLDNVVDFVKVLASSVVGSNSAVLFDVAGVGGFELDADGNPVAIDTSDDESELAPQQPVYGALGVVGRPLPPDGDLFCEAVGLRTADGLEPIAYRDLRINRALNPTGAGTAPAPGQHMLAGYGGGFVSVKRDSGSGRDTITLYVPYDYADGVPQKAHAIVIDPTSGSSSIQLIHGDGVFFTLTEDTGTGPGLVAAVNGTTFLRMSAGELVLQAAKVMLKGNVYLGAAAELGLPALYTSGFPSPIPPVPSPSVFLSQA